MALPSTSVAAALTRWRNNLVDLTHRNPLLALRTPSCLSLTISHPGMGIVVERLIKAGKSWSFWLPPEVEVGHEDAAAASGLDRIQTKPNELVCSDLGRRDLLHILTTLSQGADTELHVACGLLEWREDERNETLRSPLVLVPVALERSSTRGPFRLIPVNEDPVLNPALLARLQQDFAFHLPAPPDAWDDRSITGYLVKVEAAIAGLPGWHVERGAFLALFPAFKDVMVRDLDENVERVSAHPLVRALAGEALGKDLLPKEGELDAQPPQPTLTVLDADDSQLLCLEAAAGGHSFVLQGPPGSGKSQTIANLLADRMAAGKTILFVSEQKASLDIVYQRLRDVGLDEFCLVLHRPKADGRAVVIELGRCLQKPPPKGTDLPAEEAEVQETKLNAYAKALHQVREPLRQSARWALGELARCDGLPHIPLGLPDPADLTPDWLEQARSAVLRLQQLWHIPEQGPDFPWWGFKAEDRFTKKLRDDVTSLLERVRSRMERLTTSAQDYGGKIGATGPVPWLLRVADALETSPAPPASWLTEDLSRLTADLQQCAADYQQRGQSREPITARYGPEVWRLPIATRGQVEQSWQAVAPLLAPGDERGEGLLTHQQQLRGWAADTQRRIPGWISEARTLEKWLGITLPLGAGRSTDGRSAEGKDDPSVQLLRRLYRLAHLCVAENAPQRSWIVDPGALEQARKLIASNRPIFADLNRRRAGLMEHYTDHLFELDLEGIAQRLAGPYRSWLRVFNMQYRRDRRTMRRRCRSEVLASTWWQDVAAARDLMRQKAALDAQQPERETVLGRYERGLDTDFDAAERATRIAAEAAELAPELGCPALPGRLVEALSATAAPSEKIRASIKRLHDSLGAWQHATDELKAYLPMDALPGAGVPLEESALSVLGDYARSLQGTLNQFAVAADPVLAHAKTPPADALALLSDLRQVEELRALEETQEQDNARWASRLGPEFKGVATDWKALQKPLSWTKRVRELFKSELPGAFVKVAAGGASAAPSSRELRHAKEQLDQALHALDNRFEPPGPTWKGRRYAELAPEELTQRIDTLRGCVGELADWVDWRHVAERFAQLGLATFWEGLEKARPPHDRLADVFTKAAVGGWLERIVQQDPALGAFSATDHERLVGEFLDLERHLLRLNAQRVARLVGSRRPQASQAASDPQIALLMRAANEGDSLLTIEDLFQEIPDLLLRVKPCLLMSPLSASQFLPPNKIAFDVVVFDEASRLRVEVAVGAIYRARQAVVVGDDQALRPPSPGNGEDGDEPAAFESLLGACIHAGLVQHTLRYRDGSLEEAPAPTVEVPSEPPGLSRRSERRGQAPPLAPNPIER